MKEKKELFDQAMNLLEKCNIILKEDPELSTINSLLASVIRNLNSTVIEELTNNKANSMQ
jgi:uncharacterized protein YjgD (DUF1641 family)